MRQDSVEQVNFYTNVGVCIFSISFLYQGLFFFLSESKCLWTSITRTPAAVSSFDMSGVFVRLQ